MLAPTSVLTYELGTTSDRVNVTGNLTLAGTLNITALPGFAAGTHTLLTNTDTLMDEDGTSNETEFCLSLDPKNGSSS